MKSQPIERQPSPPTDDCLENRHVVDVPSAARQYKLCGCGSYGTEMESGEVTESGGPWVLYVVVRHTWQMDPQFVQDYATLEWYGYPRIRFIDHHYRNGAMIWWNAYAGVTPAPGIQRP